MPRQWIQSYSLDREQSSDCGQKLPWRLHWIWFSNSFKFFGTYIMQQFADWSYNCVPTWKLRIFFHLWHHACFMKYLYLICGIQTTKTNILFIDFFFTLFQLLKTSFNWEHFYWLPSKKFIFSTKMKFIYSEKATKFCKIFTLLLSYVVPVKSKVKISQNFVAFSK